MNLFFVFDDGTVVTPPLTGTILPGITRDSLIALLREEGLEVREEPYGIDQWRDDAASGKLRRDDGLRHRCGGHAGRQGGRARMANSPSARAAPAS